MKALLLSLLLGGSSAWQESQEQFTGHVCPTVEAANRVATIGVGYALRSTLQAANCQFMVLEGRRLAESDVFGIGGTLYTFITIESDDHTLYLLQEEGDGYIA